MKQGTFGNFCLEYTDLLGRTTYCFQYTARSDKRLVRIIVSRGGPPLLTMSEYSVYVTIRTDLITDYNVLKQITLTD